MPLHLIVLGPPGAGKGTQAERFARARGIPKISTGDILRDAVHAGSEIGLRAKLIMARGELVSDEVMIGIVRERLERPDARAGFVLDGFPRTVMQAAALDEMVNGRGALVVLDIVVPEAELIRRLASRLICADCGANAGAPGRLVSVMDPVGGVAADTVVLPAAVGASTLETVTAVKAQTEPLCCRRCGGRLVKRTDDNVDIVRERLKVYHRETEPLVEYYRRRPTFRAINGAQAPERVAADLVAAIEGAANGLAEAGGVRQ